MKHVLRLVKGELTLETAFWKWAVCGGLIVNIVSSALFLVLIVADRPILALIAGYAFSVPYNVIAAVGVWRTAEHYTGDQRWANLARIITVAGMVLLSVT